jgi:hypothetical protein
VLERFGGALGLLAFHHELRAAARDGDVERRLDLADVLVERAAKAREALVVDRVQLDFDRFGPQTSSPRRLCGRAEAMRRSTYWLMSDSGPGKFTTRLFPARPRSSVFCFLE